MNNYTLVYEKIKDNSNFSQYSKEYIDHCTKIFLNRVRKQFNYRAL